jgi:hypothetical protein
MGFFKTGLKDIEKLKIEGNFKKLVKLLSNKNEKIAITAFEALKDIGRDEFLNDILKICINTNHEALQNLFNEFVKNKKNTFIELILKNMNDLIQEELFEDLKEKKQISIKRYRRYLEEFREVSVPLLRMKLNSSSTTKPQRFYIAEILKEMGEDGSGIDLEHILRNEKVFYFIKNKTRFSNYRFNELREGFEIPLTELSMWEPVPKPSVLSLKPSVYDIGVTDENVHIIPELVSGQTGRFYKIPMSQLDDIQFDSNNLSFFFKN